MMPSGPTIQHRTFVIEPAFAQHVDRLAEAEVGLALMG